MAYQRNTVGLDDPNDPNVDPNQDPMNTGKQAPVPTVPGIDSGGQVAPDPTQQVTPPAPAPVVQTATPEPAPSANPVQDVIAQQAAALGPSPDQIPSNIVQAHGVNGQIIAMPGQDVSATLSNPTQLPGGPAAATPATNANLFQSKLAELMSRGLVPQATDPEIAAPLAAERLAEDRGTAKQRALLAEQNARNGTDMSGGADSRNLGILEDSAQRQGAFAGDLYKTATNDRINQLTQILGLEGNQLSEQDRLALQSELTRLQLSQNQAQYDTSNALQLGEFNATQNSQALRDLVAIIQGGGA